MEVPTGTLEVMFVILQFHITCGSTSSCFSPWDLDLTVLFYWDSSYCALIEAGYSIQKSQSLETDFNLHMYLSTLVRPNPFPSDLIPGTWTFIDFTETTAVCQGLSFLVDLEFPSIWGLPKIFA